MNTTIDITDNGNGPVIVFLHGFMETKEIWNDFEQELKNQFRIVCIDLPGHGKSAVFNQVHTMEFMAEAVKNVLDALDIKKCLLVGHSMGGYVALAFANAYPEMLTGLTLFHSHVMADDEKTKRDRERTIKIVEQSKTQFITAFIPDLFAEENKKRFADKISELQKIEKENSVEGICASLRGMKARKSHLAFLINTDIPILFIAGKEDSRIPVEKMLAQVALPKHSELLLLGNVGHMGFIEAKSATLKAISSFASRVFVV